MTSDEERRNLAAKLRETCDEIEDAGNGLTEWELAVVLNIRDDDSSAMEGLDLDDARHLADLIDRPLAHIGVNKHGRGFCTNCGCDDWCIADGSHFCPDCGVELLDD